MTKEMKIVVRVYDEVGENIANVFTTSFDRAQEELGSIERMVKKINQD